MFWTTGNAWRLQSHISPAQQHSSGCCVGQLFTNVNPVVVCWDHFSAYFFTCPVKCLFPDLGPSLLFTSMHWLPWVSSGSSKLWKDMEVQITAWVLMPPWSERILDNSAGVFPMSSVFDVWWIDSLPGIILKYLQRIGCNLISCSWIVFVSSLFLLQESSCWNFDPWFSSHLTSRPWLMFAADQTQQYFYLSVSFAKKANHLLYYARTSQCCWQGIILP